MSDALAIDGIVAITARVSNREGDVQLNAQSVKPVDTRGADERPFEITLPEERCTVSAMESLKGLLANYPGNTPVRLRVKRPSSTVVVEVARSYYVQSGPSLAADVSALLGARALS